MPVIDDKEFGRIAVRRSPKGSAMKVGLAPNGTLRISAPAYAPIFMIKRMIASSRIQIRTIYLSHPRLDVHEGMPIGKSHHLAIRVGDQLRICRQGTQIILFLPPSIPLESADVSNLVREHVIKVLRAEAKTYLPRRLATLAAEYGYEYYSVRFSHASGRWGSCNSKGVISLNIALMNIPYCLIDYVIKHELAHTKEMNHSPSFWRHVEKMDAEFTKHKAEIKKHSPSI